MLLGSNLLDFAIGLVLIYFLLSLFCSWVNEKIAGWTNLRAKTLVDGIEGLLPGIAADLLNHPLIRGMNNQHGKNGDNAGGILNSPVQLATSYIDAHTFSTALMQQVINAAVAAPVRALFTNLSDEMARNALANAFAHVRAQIRDYDYGSSAAAEAIAELDSLTQRLRAVLAPATLARTQKTYQRIRRGLQKPGKLSDDQITAFIEQVPPGGLRTVLGDHVAGLAMDLRLLGPAAQAGPGASALRDSIRRLVGNDLEERVIATIDAVPVPPAPAPGAAAKPVINLESLRTSVALLPDDQTRRSLLALIDSAQGDIGRAQHNIEVWFDSSMERLSGWYKRRTQWIILGIALVAVVLVNADSFAIANELWHNDAARQAAVAEAQKVVQNAQPAGTPTASGTTGATGSTATAPGTSTAGAAGYPAASTTTTGSTGGSAAGSSGGASCVHQDQASLSCVFGDIQSLRVPIGYTTTDPVTHMPVQWFGSRWRTLNFGEDWDILAKLLGWLATAIAISLGAPFWFDLLTKLVNLRNTGVPPAPTPATAGTPPATPTTTGQAAR